MTVILATMVRIDWVGRVLDSVICVYHSRDWERLAATGYLTHSVDEFTMASSAHA